LWVERARIARHGGIIHCMLQVQLIIGSTRPDRAAEPVARWVADRVEAHPAFEVEVLDLRDWPLPMFTETIQSVGDFRDPTYSDPIVKRWNAKIAEADAYVMITPEYNHSISGVLKNAIDNVFVSFAFRNKPALFVGYSGGAVGGARAVEQLALIAIEAELVPLRNTVLVGEVTTAFDGAGQPTVPLLDISMTVALDDLQWWGGATKAARAAGELTPGTFRRRAALAALAES
jgi:NAD(P)H-dependent FMN reductase